MTVYVDTMRARVGRMIMCHMGCPPGEVEKLHRFAHAIGIIRYDFYDKPRHPHYYICLTKKAIALGSGAIEVSQREYIKLTRGAICISPEKEE